MVLAPLEEGRQALAAVADMDRTSINTALGNINIFGDANGGTYHATYKR